MPDLVEPKLLIFSRTGSFILPIRLVSRLSWFSDVHETHTIAPTRARYDNTALIRITGEDKKKVQVGNDQEKAQSEDPPPSKKRGGKNQIDNKVLIP